MLATAVVTCGRKASVSNRCRLKETTTQDFCDILLLDRLNAFFPLSVENLEYLGNQLLAEWVALLGIGGEQ